MSHAYSFPKLTHKVLLEALAELNMNIPEQVLREPGQHVEQVSMVFEKLGHIILGVTKEDLSQPAFAGLATLRHPELHEENIAFMAFFRTVRKMMHMSRIEDFSLKDITDPKRMRLRMQLSAVINFHRFQLERNVWHRTLLAQGEASAAEAQRAQAEHDKLVDEIEIIKEQNVEKDKAIEQVMSDCTAVAQDISELNRVESKLRDESTTLKQENHVVKDKVATAIAALKQAQVERDRLRGQVVTSPQRLLREVADQKQALEQELEDVAGEVRKQTELEKAAQVVQKARRDLLKASAAVEEVATELNKQEAGYKEVKLTHRKIVEKRDEYSARASEVEESQRKLRRFEEKLSHLQKQVEVKSESNSRDLEAVSLAIHQAEENLKHASARLKAREPVLAQLKKDKENMEDEIELQRTEGKQLLEEVGRMCRRHNERLFCSMQQMSINMPPNIPA